MAFLFIPLFRASRYRKSDFMIFHCSDPLRRETPLPPTTSPTGVSPDLPVPTEHRPITYKADKLDSQYRI
jgi:hypothetical protein